MSHPSVSDGLGIIRPATMCSSGLDDAPEVFTQANESVICHLCLIQCGSICMTVCMGALIPDVHVPVPVHTCNSNV